MTIDEPTVFGGIVFDASHGYTLSGIGPNALTLNNSGRIATIEVTDGNGVINAPVVLADNLVVSGSGTLTFGISSSIAGNYSLTMNGAGGTLILSGSDDYTGGTNVTSGMLILASNDAIANGTSLTVGANPMLVFGVSVTGTQVAPVQVSTVPEPSTLILFSVAVCGAAEFRRISSRWKK